MDDNLLMAIVEPSNLIGGAVAVLTFATVLTLAMPLFKGDKLDARMKSVANRREELRRASRAAIAGGGPSIRRTDDSKFKSIVERLQLSRLLEDPKVAENLMQAGYRGPKPLTTFYFFRFATPILFLFCALIYVNAINPTFKPMMKVLIVTCAIVAGFYGPNIFLKNRITKRRESIVGAFPDALDLLLICVESGMSIEAAVQKVSGEIGGQSIELAEELTLLTAELSYLPERRSAYDGLSKRTNHPGVKAVATAMIQAERYGTPLGGALRVMAKENRDLRIAAAEKKAAQLPAKLTVPMIVFFLPVLFIVIMTPAMMRVFASSKPHPKSDHPPIVAER